MEKRPGRYTGKKIMVFSTKGGAGKSFIAVNLAIALYNQDRKAVVLIDMDYKSSDDASILNVTPQKTIYNITLNMNNLNLNTLDNFLTSHNSGIRFLPAPVNSREEEFISVDLSVNIVEMLSEVYDYLVIDTPAFFSDNVLEILDRVDYLCMVATMDILSIKNLKESLFILKQLRFPRDKIILILNRANSKVGLTIDEAEGRIGEKIDITIPSDRLVPLSINEGIPVIMKFPKSPVCLSIDKLAKLII
ncbi:MAG: P-loop NTPase [Actinobacteria bacterium]|nr:P-loop NTPase [Actinomycetota bacterium]